MSLRLGSVVGRYRIEATVGRGGMGIVYLATDLELERPVAVKVLAPELAEDPDFRARFVREARLAASIEHPAIVAIYDVGEVEGQLLLAMRYIPGEDLGRILRAEAPLEPERVLSILGQVAGALDAAHERGLVHRDVKPANILVQPDPPSVERAYLVDFGLTRLKAASRAMTRTGQLLGTIDSVAPEQIVGGAIDGRADQYSLACVLFHAVAGSPPFEADHEAAVLFAHVHEPPPRASERRSGLPPALDAVIARGMAKDPDERHGSCRELISDAREAITGIAGAAPAKSRVRGRVRSVPGMGGSDGRDSAVAAVLGIAVAAVALVVAGTVAFSGRPSASPPFGEASLPGGAALVGDPERPSPSPASTDGAGAVAPTTSHGGVPALTATPLPASPTPSGAGTSDPVSPDPEPRQPPDGGVVPTPTPDVTPAATPTPDRPPEPTPEPTRTPAPTPPPPPPGPDADAPPTGRIVLVSEADGDAEIYLLRRSGGLRRLTDNDWDDRSPALSPDGRRVAFDADPGGNRDLYVIDADGSGLRRLTTDAASDHEAAWSPRGDRLAFVSTRGGDTAVYVLDDIGAAEPAQTPRRVTEGHLDRDPRWSGRTIAYGTVRSRSFEIWYVKPDGPDFQGTGLPEARQFTSGEGGHHSPAWSPDGSLLASVHRHADFRMEIVFMPSDRLAPVRVGHTDDVSGPTWSPDGRYLAFGRLIDGERTILIHDRTTGTTRALAVGLADASEPDWGADPRG